MGACGASIKKPLQPGFARGKTGKPPFGRGKAAPFGGWRHHLCPGGKRVTGFSVAQGLPTNPVPLPPRYSVGRQKESAFMGRLGALLRPTCTSYAGCAQWDYGCSAMCHMTPQESVEQTSPSGERGAFPTSAARLYGFRCLWQRCRLRRHICLSPEGRYLPFSTF